MGLIMLYGVEVLYQMIEFVSSIEVVVFSRFDGVEKDKGFVFVLGVEGIYIMGFFCQGKNVDIFGFEQMDYVGNWCIVQVLCFMQGSCCFFRVQVVQVWQICLWQIEVIFNLLINFEGNCVSCEGIGFYGICYF